MIIKNNKLCIVIVISILNLDFTLFYNSHAYQDLEQIYIINLKK